jgi:hypothetical protein
MMTANGVVDKIKNFLYAKRNIITIRINELYDFSLLHTEKLRPWVVDEEGVWCALDARCQFVKLYLEKGGNLTKEDIAATPYFNSLKKGINDKPRDGGRIWIYEDPEGQVVRFKQLITSLYEYGYIVDRYSKILDRFSLTTNAHTERTIDGEIVVVDYKDRPFAGLISVIPHEGFFLVWNGAHRLAILKVFIEKSIITREEIPVIVSK